MTQPPPTGRGWGGGVCSTPLLLESRDSRVHIMNLFSCLHLTLRSPGGQSGPVSVLPLTSPHGSVTSSGRTAASRGEKEPSSYRCCSWSRRTGPGRVGSWGRRQAAAHCRAALARVRTHALAGCGRAAEGQRHQVRQRNTCFRCRSRSELFRTWVERKDE